MYGPKIGGGGTAAGAGALAATGAGPLGWYLLIAAVVLVAGFFLLRSVSRKKQSVQ
ncbi:hypothetical protein SAMN04489740_0518 [Arthrobacter alpinus]|uniref:LPXTG-motif cell wall anchor domain-containing protein n=1 Tax=Arthrobacter alpinus TaxID=656366 RepID=A0A1H5FIJ9_9MICC|nr:hypothetical protein [Arthrobacter alpinus]SEE03242.1 hypothetical protein SAMN04489740_0518 [Arthrobacter alpinus]